MTRNHGHAIRTTLAILIALIAALTLAGCASTGGSAMNGSNPATMKKPTVMNASAGNQLASTSATAGAVQECAVCAGKGMAPMVKGEATNENGVQVVRIGVKNGYYSPNMFMVKAGQPVKVVFTGKATDCLAKPMFPSLNKKTDFSAGSAILDLGTLAPGTYEFACGMKMTGGKIVAQ